MFRNEFFFLIRLNLIPVTESFSVDAMSSIINCVSFDSADGRHFDAIRWEQHAKLLTVEFQK